MELTRRQLRHLIVETMYSHELAGYLDGGQPPARGDTLHLEMERIDKEDGSFHIVNTYVDRLTGEKWDHGDIMGDAVRLGHIDDRGYPNPFMVLYNMGYKTLIEDEVERHGIAGLAGIRDY
jgi:hypothetical protein